ncbi:hypothetical protein LTR37_017833 [Vermiconidia calcicola]|uniref:Uncharacterized protein n=1 Tax=Vermiconidia calcicola TaxID=1690605 RepID=A0ACC3MIQ7_9PEZI|nr:hypothetical protein LTR37_017833 [Vermiconidia calcicola]
MSTDIAGLREQIIEALANMDIKANALRLFPEKAALRETLGQTYPSGDNFNISVAGVPRLPTIYDKLEVGYYQATLTVSRGLALSETLLKGRCARFGARDTEGIALALENLLHVTVETLMKCDGKSFSEATREGMNFDV